MGPRPDHVYSLTAVRYWMSIRRNLARQRRWRGSLPLHKRVKLGRLLPSRKGGGLLTPIPKVVTVPVRPVR
jgi:hypothetical protein